MDEIYNLLNSPAFWFGSVFLPVLLAIFANRIDKIIPPLSLSLAYPIVLSYVSLSVFLIIHASIYHFHPPFAPNRPPILDKPISEESVVATLAAFLPPLFLGAALDLPSERFPEACRNIKMMTVTSVLALYAFTVIVIARERGWTENAFQMYQLGSLVLAYLFIFGSMLIVITKWVQAGMR